MTAGGAAATAPLAVVERILQARECAPRRCLAAAAVGAAVHGAALGAASGHWAMAVFSAVKVPLLLLVASLVTLPLFYVLHAVLGLRGQFAVACRSLFAAQATLAITLGALAPLFVFCAVSGPDPYLLTVIDGAMFLVAVLAAQVVLRRHYAPLLRESPLHRVTLAGWGALYALFGIQFAWVLRPFLGTPGYPVEFLRATAFEQNAFVVLFDHIARLLPR